MAVNRNSKSRDNIEIPLVFRSLEARNSEFNQYRESFIDVPVKIVDDVRITPSFIHFANAYEGKSFNEKLIIQNIGKNGSFVRMMPPSSNTFQVKYFKEGQRLSAGLKIVRTISYRFMTTIAVPQAVIPIWINDKLIEIKILVTIMTAEISLDPQIVDFGRIDADHAASMRTLTIHNKGHKGAQFAIDLGSNELHLVVEPMKGIIFAESSMCLKIELIGFMAGEFLQEFWIKTSPPKRVIVKGTFIQPKILTPSFFDSLSFSIVEFPRTYYGARSIKPLFIRNYSSSNSMFYIMAEIRGKIMTLKEARQIDDNYKQFSLQPYDGRMYADKGSLVLITFAPKRFQNQTHEKNHFACFLRAIRMNWIDVTRGIFKEEVEFSSDDKSLDDSIIKLETNAEEHGYQNLQHDITSTVKEVHDMMESSLKVAIYGDIETPKIQIRPDLLVLEDLELGGNYTRELFIQNRSKYNAISIKYCKIVNIDIVPDKFKLNRREATEVTVKIHPVQIGTYSKNIVFELLYPDIPDSNGKLRKIGQVSMRIQYNAKMSRKVAKKTCNTSGDLEEYLQEPSTDYKLAPKEIELKNANKIYYSDYLKKIASKPHAVPNDYDLTDKRLLLFENYKCKSISVLRLEPKDLTDYFIPLSPKQLYSIRISPKFINLKKLAPATTITKTIRIENQNNFPIRVYLKSLKPSITFQDSQRAIIDRKQSKTIAFNFLANTICKHNVTIQIVINDSHIYQTSIIANIIQKNIRLVDKKIEFSENDGSYKLVKIFNDLNSNVNFEWDVSESRFNIHPRSGTIHPEGFIYCAIYHLPNPVYADKTECSVFSETTLKQIVQLSSRMPQPKVQLVPEQLDCGLIPINTPIWRMITLINQKQSIVYYRLENPRPLEGIEIQPQEGAMDFKDELRLSVKLHFKTPMMFTTKLIIHLQELEELKVNITGTVDYPQIIIKPDYLQFTNIIPQSYKHLLIKIQNLSPYPNRIEFKLDNFPELKISENEEILEIIPKKIQLESNELKTLYCHFQTEETCDYTLYLPIIINDLIEMPLISDPQTLLKIKCCTREPILEISSLQTNFVYFAENHPSNWITELIKFTNISPNSVEITLRLENLDPVFEIVPVDLGTTTFQLDRDEFAVFQVNFVPKSIGNYRDKVPIFLNKRLFNYLKLFGNFQLPDLVPERSVIYFEPVPLNLRIEQELVLIVANHENCQISTRTDIAILTINYQDDPFITCDSTNKTLILSLKSPKLSSIDDDLEIFCTCGSTCIVRIKATVINSLITTHHCYEQIIKFYNGNFSEATYKNCENFPKFPDNKDDSFYGNHQREVLKNVQSWLFLYGFYKKKYHRIPESFTHVHLSDASDTTDRRRSKSKPKNEPPIVELIANLVGKNHRKYLIKSSLKSMKEIDQLSYIFEINVNVLDYLRKSGALLPHVEAKLLLNYWQYLLYNKLKEDSQQCYTYKQFHLLSKQSWLDLILQVMKIFALERKMNGINHDISHDLYSRKTIKLMEWLKERSVKENPKLSEYFNNFQLLRSLRDGIILSYVTLSYCSYCTDFLKNTITRPTSDEEIFHNCCNLMEMWKSLRFNIHLDPLRLYKPELIDLWLLVSYLYDVLPDCVPQESLIIDAPLSEYGSVDLIVTNPYRFHIVYDVNLFDNKDEIYVIKERSIKIPAKESVTLSIKYWAKFIEKSSSILLLTNDHYKGAMYNLIGNPDFNHYTEKVELKLQLYEIKELDIFLQSPYRVNCNYKSMYTYTPGDKLHDFSTITSILFHHPDEIEADETGHCLIKIKICCFEMDQRPIWVYYLDPTIGDWCVKFIINIKYPNDKFRMIQINLPKQYDNFKCTCQHGPDLNHLNCPKMIKIPVPARNFYLWEARKELLLENISAEDYELWKYRLNTSSGARIIELMVLSSLKSMDISQEYRVEFVNKPPFIYKETLKIPDVLMEDSVNFAIHPINDMNDIKVAMSLTSLDGKELRYYQINFFSMTI